MTQHIYEITLPAFLGMQSYARELDAVRMAMQPYSYTELPMAQRVFNSSGNKIQHAVYIFRLCITEEEFAAVSQAIAANFTGRLYSIECRDFWTPPEAA